MVIGSDGMILYASDKMETFMGLSPRDVIGHSLHDLVETDEDSKTIDENLETKGLTLCVCVCVCVCTYTLAADRK